MVTAFAPSANAFTISVPRVTPPSITMSDFAARCLDDLRQRVDRAAAMIQLPPAVIRYVDNVNAVIDCNLGVFRRCDTFDDQRHAGDFFDHPAISQVSIA